jgi:hypothetical protein
MCMCIVAVYNEYTIQTFTYVLWITTLQPTLKPIGQTSQTVLYYGTSLRTSSVSPREE